MSKEIPQIAELLHQMSRVPRSDQIEIAKQILKIEEGSKGDLSDPRIVITQGENQ